MRSKWHKRDLEISSDEGNLNLTPLIDVVFVVLIMFIVIAPMLELDRIKLPPSAPLENQRASLHEQSAIVLRVYEDNSVVLNGQKIALTNLSSELTKLKRLSPHTIPQLFHDKKGYFGTFQQVKNALEQAGFEELDVALQP